MNLKKRNNNTKVKKQKTIKSKLILLMLSISIIPIVIVSIISLSQINSITSSNFESTSTETTENSKDLLDIQFQSIINSIKSFADDDLFSFGAFENDTTIDSMPQIKNNLRLIKNSNNSILSCTFTLAKSKSTYTYPEEMAIDSKDPTSIESYKGGLSYASSHNPFITNIYKSSITGNDCVTISYGIRTNNENVGVISVDLDLQGLSESLTNILGANNNYTFILTDSNGEIIASTDENIVTANDVKNYSIWEEIASNVRGTDTFSLNSKKYFASYETSDTTGWKFICTIPESVLTKSQRSLFVYFLLILILAITCIVLVSGIFSKKIANNIQLIKKSLIEASKGNFNTSIKVNSGDEFDELAESFNKMSTNISSLLGNVNLSAQNVSSSSVKLNDMSKSLSSSISTVNDSTSKIALGTSKSTEDIDILTSSMNNVSDSVNSIDSLTENVNAMANKANILSNDGLEIIKSLIEKSTETKNNTSQVDSIINLIFKSVQKIGKMNESITKITEQTNMLSLNASIEAARAGESGKGFAVVANQIKKLAEMTADSASNINATVKDINQNVLNAVNKSKQTVQAVEHQEHSVKESETIFTNIISSINSLSLKVNNIANDLNTLSSKKDEVLNQVSNISNIVNDTSEGASKVSSSCEKVNDTTVKFFEASNKLKELSDNLEKELNKFTYSSNK
ncbi:methyl-accepting chemotaxis protein [Clostridium sp. BJN0001]|uniref:methyl-accepting chemotaxis protein n=1 Tax=Clostridium sp. BJN0001 TaxID=2930219 RepID=UPI001FD03C83|nr:methyl-accepting chemotaxis protein [Clostridium sp. BJN0001]